MLKLKWRIKLWWRKLFGKTPPAMPHYIYESKNGMLNYNEKKDTTSRGM